MGDLRLRAKALAGRVPWAPEAYQGLIAGGRPPATGFALGRLEQVLGSWTAAVGRTSDGRNAARGRHVLVLGYLPWWLELSVALGLLLASRGHAVDLGFVPYRRWTVPVDRFDDARQRAYLRSLLRAAKPLTPVDLSRPSTESLPRELEAAVDRQAMTDVEYTLQKEQPDVAPGTEGGRLLALRQARNRAAAARALRLFRRTSYDAVVIPNGSILEFGAVYHTARHLGLPTVTYEFGEQRQRAWVCRDGEAMRLETGDLWRARGHASLTPGERRQIEELMRARTGGVEWQQFGRRWQKGERQGAESVLSRLGLDPTRPIILLATNVVGDSLALNRQVFSGGMADWLSQSLKYLAPRNEVQTVVRIHPGELLGAGMPSEQVVRRTLPHVPPHVVLIPPDSKVNTYDLIESAHLGLVYTSTAGLEMAMHGVPVVTAGQTHYRGKGFTDDPESYEAYFHDLEARLAEPVGRRLSPAQVDLAWRYAHRFFFEFPFAFPWHLLHFWKDMDERPLETLVRSDGPDAYREVLDVMAGAPIDWEAHAHAA
ncbi:MAG TPA: hypothetical protein VLD63_09905 [Anaerolineales bacterium]|nr:hypothetical protein [Anaerolineales bacterium]